jgi:signal peptidase II
VQAGGRTNPLAAKARGLLYLTAIAGFVADQVTKVVAVSKLHEGVSVPFIDHFWYWTLQRNPGAAFSLFQRAPVVFTVLAIAIAVAIVAYSPRVADRWTGLALGLVLAGALGNLADRIIRPPGPFRGHVIDFVDWRVWPTFNVADACVVVGALLLLIGSIRADRAAKRDPAAAQQ